jgi:hypothetical protein
VFILGWFAFVLFFPGKEAYMTLERMANERHIVLNERELKERVGGFAVNDIDLYFDGMSLGNVKRLQCRIWYLYNSCSAEGVRMERAFASVIPEHFSKIRVEYHILRPTKIRIKASGDVGYLKGYADLTDRKVRLYIDTPSHAGKWRRLLKKDEKGWYYETSY